MVEISPGRGLQQRQGSILLPDVGKLLLPLSVTMSQTGRDVSRELVCRDIWKDTSFPCLG